MNKIKEHLHSWFMYWDQFENKPVARLVEFCTVFMICYLASLALISVIFSFIYIMFTSKVAFTSILFMLLVLVPAALKYGKDVR